MPFALISERVQVGDIVLVSRAAFWPFWIRLITLSKYSHALICTKPGTLLEAVPDGVLRQDVFEIYATKRKWLRVLRPKRALVPNECGLNVEHYAEQKYEYKYSKMGAIATIVPKWTFDDPGAVFCSRLVAEAYAEYGLNLCPGKDVRKIKPGTLAKSPELDNVTEKCVRELAIGESDRFNLMRATSENTVAEELMKIGQRSLSEIKERLKTRLPPDIYSLPMLRYWLSLNSSAAQAVDAEIMEILKEQGYVNAMDEWLASVDDLTRQIDEDTAVVLQRPKAPAAEVDRVVSILSERVPASEDRLTDRRLTMEEHEEMVRKAPHATLIYFRDLYRRTYDCFQNNRRAYLRFLDAVKSLSQED